ncbi:hypothetical protein ABPG74_005942 [Tetrahymena malaccensis]
MSSDSSYYNDCDSINFLSWSSSASNSLFSIILLQFITYIIYQTSPIDKETFNIFNCFAFYLALVCSIGLSVSHVSNCGQLSQLALAFIIMTFIILVAIAIHTVYKIVQNYRNKK